MTVSGDVWDKSVEQSRKKAIAELLKFWPAEDVYATKKDGTPIHRLEVVKAPENLDVTHHFQWVEGPLSPNPTQTQLAIVKHCQPWWMVLCACNSWAAGDKHSRLLSFHARAVIKGNENNVSGLIQSKVKGALSGKAAKGVPKKNRAKNHAREAVKKAMRREYRDDKTFRQAMSNWKTSPPSNIYISEKQTTTVFTVTLANLKSEAWEASIDSQKKLFGEAKGL